MLCALIVCCSGSNNIIYVVDLELQNFKFANFFVGRPVSLCVCLSFEKVYIYSNLFNILRMVSYVFGQFCV